MVVERKDINKFMYLSFLFQVYKALFAMLSGRNFLVLCDIDTGTTHFSQVISHAKNIIQSMWLHTVQKRLQEKKNKRMLA